MFTSTSTEGLVNKNLFLKKTFTLAPFCRSISVIAFPIPIAAPVTAAILPFNAISAAQSEEEEVVGCLREI